MLSKRWSLLHSLTRLIQKCLSLLWEGAAEWTDVSYLATMKDLVSVTCSPLLYLIHLPMPLPHPQYVVWHGVRNWRKQPVNLLIAVLNLFTAPQPPFVSFLMMYFILELLALAFKSQLSGVLYQRLSENPDKLCSVPLNCQTRISLLHRAWQFCWSGITLFLQFTFTSLTLIPARQIRDLVPFDTGSP